MIESTSSSSLWTQFRAAYPTASLISELLHIHENQYIVRVQIQSGSLILATALSGDRHLETAEDRARERAITLLQLPSIQPHPAPSSVPPTAVEPAVELAPPPEPSPPKPPAPKPQAKAPKVPEPEPEPWLPIPPLEDDLEDYTDRPLPPPPEPEPQPLPEPEEEFDFSDISLKIDMELKHIKWNSKRESDYLQRMYGKNKRMVLGDEEMKEFLEYLQTYAQTDVELERVGWTPQQGKDYLKSQYPESQGSRLMLTCSQIKEFLNHLQATSVSGKPSEEEFF